jgi:hypothetical protein
MDNATVLKDALLDSTAIILDFVRINIQLARFVILDQPVHVDLPRIVNF